MIMKKTGLAVFFAALMSVLGLTSCLNGDGDTSGVGQAWVKVSGFPGFYTFTTANGYTINPTNQSVLTSELGADYAYLIYQYDETSLVEGSKEMNVALTGCMPIKTANAYSSVEQMDSLYANAPLSSVSEQTGPLFWDKENVFVPISYYITQTSDDTAKNTELNKHNFQIYYDVNGGSDTELILKLRHNVADPDNNSKRLVPVWEYKHFNLAQALNAFSMAKGRQPSTISIEYEKGYSGDYTAGNIQLTKHSIDYQRILDVLNSSQK